jgi:multiple sugar transport system permease protein
MNMRFRLIITSILAVIALTLCISASAKETVVFWFGATQDERAAYEEMVREFNRAHPNIEVRPMLVPQQYVERKLILSAAGGVPPDVVRFYTHLAGEMMSRGAVEPLDSLVKRDRFDLSDFYPVGIRQNTYQSKLYGIPWIFSPEALFYNKKLFREAGLDPNRPPQTWDELKQYALKLTVRGKDGSIERIGFADFMNNPPDFHRYLWQDGGTPLSPDQKRIAFNSREGVEALTWMRDFLNKEAGPISGKPDPGDAFKNLQSFNSSFVGATQDTFGLEKLAMRISSPFRIPDLKKYFPDLEYGIAPVPYNKARAVEVVGNALIIPRGSKHKDAAWEFIKFATSRGQLLKICKAAGRVPARMSAAKSPEFLSNSLMKPFVAQIDYGRTTPIAPGYREVSDTLARKIESALKGELSPEVALNQAAAKGQEILNVANEDVAKYPLLPWGKVAMVTGVLALILAIGGVWHVLHHTRQSRSARREAIHFYMFLSPWLIGFVVLTLGSTVASLMLSLCRWDMLNPARFVGIKNFADLFTNDPRFITSIGNTLYYAAFSIPLSIVGGLAISVLMNQKLKGIQIFRTIYYLPAIVSGVATVILWQFIFNPSNGLLNRILGMVGLDQLIAHLGVKVPAQWLAEPSLAKPAFIIMSLWGVGGAMIIYLAGLQGIPEELYEAARLDGATSWQTFRRVTLPLLTPTIFYQLIIGTLAAFQFFTQAYIMTGGGPQDSTLFYSLYLFKNGFEWLKMGYASAMAWILFAVVLGVTMLQFKGAKRWVYYEGKAEE